MAVQIQRYVRGPLTMDNVQAERFPEDWQREIYQKKPRVARRAPITAFLLAVPTKGCKSQKVHWGESDYPEQSGEINTGIFTNEGLGTAVSGTTADATSVVLQCTNDVCSGILENMYLELFNSNASASTQVAVLKVNILDDAHSTITVLTIGADTAQVLVGTGQTFVVVQHAQPQGSMLPEGLSTELDLFENITNIQMCAYDYTGSEESEMERFTPDSITDRKMNSYARYLQGWERALLMSKTSYRIVDHKRLTTMNGFRGLMQTYLPANLIDLSTYTFSGASAPGSPQTGQSFRTYGYDMLQYLAIELAKKSQAEAKDVYCGSGVFLFLDILAREIGDLKIERTETKIGLHMKTLIGLTQQWNFIQHPQFDIIPGYFNAAYVTEMELLKFMPKTGRHTTFVPGNQSSVPGSLWRDATKAGWYGEYTCMSNNFESQAWITGWGKDHA